MPGRKVFRTNMGLGVGSYAWSIPSNILFRAVLSPLQVFIILIAVVVCFWSISDQKKAIMVSSVCSLPIMDATIASKAQIAGYHA